MATFAAITTVSPEKESNSGMFRHRTVGVFPTVDSAAEVLAFNLGDLNEAGYYPHAVVEELPFGLYPSAQAPVGAARWWFEYRDGRWAELPGEPEWVAAWQLRLHVRLAGFASIG